MAEASLRAAPQPSTRAETEDAFLDAAERLLIDVGYSGISTRRLAEEAGANHGLVHYYFGSMENLFVRVLERFTERLIARQRAMYARTDISSLEKWKTAMGYLESDLAAGYPKIWLELQALGWNRPDIAERVAESSQDFGGEGRMLFGASRHGIDFALEVLVLRWARFFQRDVIGVRVAMKATGLNHESSAS